MDISWKKFIFAAVVSGACFAVTPAHAGAMPDTRNEASSILDQALQDIQQNTQPAEEELVIIPTPAPEPAPVIVEEVPVQEPEFEPQPQLVVDTPEPEPVPEERVVDVQDNKSFFGLSVGLYDAFTHDDLAASFNFEWQPGVKLLGKLQPLFGGLVTTDGSFLGYGGLGVPMKIRDNWLVMPSVSAGYYEQGDGFDLDSHLAYRVGTEIAYVFDNQSRLGLNIHAITNGSSINSDDRTEVISLVYTTPLGKFPRFKK